MSSESEPAAPRGPVPRTASRAGLLSLLAWPLAWLGLSIGLGIGMPWLRDDGVSAVSLLGLAALAAGLLALAAGTVWVLRAARGWWKVLLLPWLVTVAVGTYSLSIALASTQVAPTPVAAAPNEVADGFEVTFETRDGSRLAGWFLPGSNQAAVIVRHGAGSQRFSTAEQAAVLAEGGYSVLMVDARGHGNSGGRAMDLGWNGEVDTAAAVEYLSAQHGIDRVGILGLSMGGEEAIGAAGVDPRILAVVAEGATGRTAADKDWLPEEYGGAGTVQVLLDRLTYALVDLLSSPAPPSSLIDAVGTSKAPMLLIAGGKVPDEAEVAQRLAAVAPDRVSVWVVPAAGHTAGLESSPGQWQRSVLAFFDEALLAQRPVAGAPAS